MQPELYTSVANPEILSRYIRRFLVADCQEGVDLSTRVKPTGYLYLGWLFDGSIRVTIDSQPALNNVGPEYVHISGQIQNQIIDLRYTGTCGHVLVEFTALGFFQLTGMPAIDFTGTFVSLADANPTLSAELRGCAKQALTCKRNEDRPALCLQALQAFLTCRAQSPNEVPGYLESAVTIIEREHGVIKIADVASAVGISMRQLNRTFSHCVGVPPKYFCSLLQMNRALQALMENDKYFMAELAQFLGYYDQAHFNRVISKFISESPRGFVEKDEALLFEFLDDSA